VEYSYDFLFALARFGIEIQKQINSSRVAWIVGHYRSFDPYQSADGKFSRSFLSLYRPAASLALIKCFKCITRTSTSSTTSIVAKLKAASNEGMPFSAVSISIA